MCVRQRLLTGCLLLLLLGVGQLSTPFSPSTRAADAQCFPETGYCVAEPFLSYWREHGGLAINGYPISDVFSQNLDGTTSYDVQYFERVRMERHPENQPPHRVLLGQFGRTLYVTSYANTVSALPDADYFGETGHNLSGKFRDYWQAHGGLAQFGYPLSEVIRERLEDGNEYSVQYFERARFELHPENPAPYDVLLGQFGRRMLSALDPDRPLPFPISGSRGQLYQGSYGASERARLMLPTAAERQQAGVVQHFDRGKMIWDGAARKIYVFAFDASSDEHYGRWLVFDDTWEEGQDPGGYPAPVPDRYTPRRGFGKVWRSNPEVQRLLGYALTPDEAAITLMVQPFQGGMMIESLDGIRMSKTRSIQGVYIIYNTGRFWFSGLPY